ncbi:hypothetical protein D1872_283240 [compost metagenome]
MAGNKIMHIRNNTRYPYRTVLDTTTIVIMLMSHMGVLFSSVNSVTSLRSRKFRDAS